MNEVDFGIDLSSQNKGSYALMAELSRAIEQVDNSRRVMEDFEKNIEQYIEKKVMDLLNSQSLSRGEMMDIAVMVVERYLGYSKKIQESSGMWTNSVAYTSWSGRSI